jgi:ribosomal protein S18 acetylase RimI-like enzyme
MTQARQALESRDSSARVRIATRAEEAAVVDVITLGFSADPMARWSFPDPRTYLTQMPRLVRAFGGKAFDEGSAYCVEGYAGAALWLPPGVEPDTEQLGAIIESHVPAHAQADANGVFEQMGVFHPTEPHWYLPLIAVDPARQGQGHGSALLREALARCDRDGLLAYLESSNPRNISLYKRHGFEVMGTIQVGSSPTLTPMSRKPR